MTPQGTSPAIHPGAAIHTDTAIHTDAVGHRFGAHWALRDCSLRLPPGSITAVVGPNGAGKTTLLHMIVGLLGPSEGSVHVMGDVPGSRTEFLARVGFLAQECPLYREFTVRDLLRFGRAMNPSWDDALARERLAAVDVPLNRRAGTLSGGQRAQVALALAIAKRPDVLVLDEPLAALDPLARRDFLRTMLGVAGETAMTVVLSSHLVSDLARVCDHLVVIRDGRVRLDGEIDRLLAEHHRVAGPADQTAHLPSRVEVISDTVHPRHHQLLVRTTEPLLNPALTLEPIDLEELVLAYLERPIATTEPPRVITAVSQR